MKNETQQTNSKGQLTPETVARLARSSTSSSNSLRRWETVISPFARRPALAKSPPCTVTRSSFFLEICNNNIKQGLWHMYRSKDGLLRQLVLGTPKKNQTKHGRQKNVVHGKRTRYMTTNLLPLGTGDLMQNEKKYLYLQKLNAAFPFWTPTFSPPSKRDIRLPLVSQRVMNHFVNRECNASFTSRS